MMELKILLCGAWWQESGKITEKRNHRMKYMKRAACLALSVALVASAGIVPLAQAAVPVSASVLEEWKRQRSKV